MRAPINEYYTDKEYEFALKEMRRSWLCVAEAHRGLPTVCSSGSGTMRRLWAMA